MGRHKEVENFPEEERFEIRGMFLSGTGTTEKIVRTVAAKMTECLSAEETAEASRGAGAKAVFRGAETIDFTPLQAREKVYSFGPSDIVVFGVPVIAGRVPNVLLPFLNTLEGGGAMAVPVVLYGNRNFDDALIELRNILEEHAR